MPWRERTTDATPSGRDPYRSLVSEVMLQQTQVSRVIEKYGPFLAAFPTIQALADASESDVLAQWSGLGYYRRGRNLHACAKAIVADHEGVVPSDAPTLESLPGIGAYTAGALSSIVFGQPAPTVDGNITRVLLRIDGIDHAHGSPEAAAHAWDRAADLVASTEHPGQLNEALMELGATVCTPRSPSCSSCPVSGQCVARREGRTGEIPRPRVRAAKKPLFAWTIKAFTDDHVLVRRRSSKGLWAGLWELPTLETVDDEPPALLSELKTTATSRTGLEFDFATTHRAVKFRVTEFGPLDRPTAARIDELLPDAEWVEPEEALSRGVSSPQRRIIETATQGSLFA
ncbi:MAG: A/G-specific adenine glycosylase [Planctomycetota bacterium]